MAEVEKKKHMERQERRHEKGPRSEEGQPRRSEKRREAKSKEYSKEGMKEGSEGTEREAPQLPERARAWVAVAGGVCVLVCFMFCLWFVGACWRPMLACCAVMCAVLCCAVCFVWLFVLEESYMAGGLWWPRQKATAAGQDQVKKKGVEPSLKLN